MKHKRTRQQKIIADLRRRLQGQNQYNEVAEISLAATPAQPTYIPTPIRLTTLTTSTTTTPVSYEYLLPDLTKTGIVTITILGTELLLFFLIKAHVITVPFLNFLNF